jgi:hypothetical protein
MGPTTPLPVTTGRRSGRSSSRSGAGSSLCEDVVGGHCGWLYRTSLTVLAAIGLSTLVTFTLLNAYVHGLSPVSSPGLGGRAAPPGGDGAGAARLLAMLPPGGVTTIMSDGQGGAAAAAAANTSSSAAATAAAAKTAASKTAAAAGGAAPPYPHPFTDEKYRIYTIPAHDASPRCAQSKICDGDHSCGPDKLGCVTDAKKRQQHIREAIRWSWQGYR